MVPAKVFEVLPLLRINTCTEAVLLISYPCHCYCADESLTPLLSADGLENMLNLRVLSILATALSGVTQIAVHLKNF